MNLFKAEIYKFCKSKIIYVSLIICFLYSLFGNYVYYTNHYEIKELYANFGTEYILIFMVLCIFYSIYLFKEDIQKKIYYEYPQKMFIIKIIMLILYNILIILLTLLFSYTMSVIIFSKVVVDIKLLKNILSIMPMLLFYEGLIIALYNLLKNSNLCLIVIAFILAMKNYMLEIKFLRYSIILNLDLQNPLYNKYFNYLHFIFILILFMLSGYYLFSRKVIVLSKNK